MWHIADGPLAKMWREKQRLTYIAIAMLFLSTAVAAILFKPDQRILVFGVIAVIVISLLLIAMLWETRYRISKGLYGQRQSETIEFERWMELQDRGILRGIRLD